MRRPTSFEAMFVGLWLLIAAATFEHWSHRSYWEQLLSLL